MFRLDYEIVEKEYQIKGKQTPQWFSPFCSPPNQILSEPFGFG